MEVLMSAKARDSEADPVSWVTTEEINQSHWVPIFMGTTIEERGRRDAHHPLRYSVIPGAAKRRPGIQRLYQFEARPGMTYRGVLMSAKARDSEADPVSWATTAEISQSHWVPIFMGTTTAME